MGNIFDKKPRDLRNANEYMEIIHILNDIECGENFKLVVKSKSNFMIYYKETPVFSHSVKLRSYRDIFSDILLKLIKIKEDEKIMLNILLNSI